MPTLSDIPVDILLDNLLPVIDIPDLLNLSATSRFFAILAADETFWKRRLQDDFNFSGAGTARTSAWKIIYKGMSKPSIYTWGYVLFRSTSKRLTRLLQAEKERTARF